MDIKIARIFCTTCAKFIIEMRRKVTGRAILLLSFVLFIASFSTHETRSPRLRIDLSCAAAIFQIIFSASRFDALQVQNDAHLFRSVAILFSGWPVGRPCLIGEKCGGESRTS